MLCQMIYTSTSAAGVSLSDKVNVAAYSVSNCNELGLTGRVLVVPDMALNVLEGPESILTAYVDAIKNDAMIDLLIIHHQQPIEARKFEDYSVWMTYAAGETVKGVHRLTPENFETTLPDDLPRKTRLFIDANFVIPMADA